MTEGGLKTVKCPQCKKVSNLPQEGVDGLITSLAIRNLAEKHPEGIKQRKKQMRDALEKRNEQKTEILEEEEKVQKRITASVNQEIREVEKAVESVMVQAQETISQIRDLGKSKISQTQKNIADIKRQKADIEHLQNKLKTITDEEFLTQTDKLVNQIGKLKIDESPVRRREDHHFGTFIMAKNVQLGRFVESRRLELVHEFGDFGSACGIAAKPNGILAVCDRHSNPQQVFVYKYNNCVYKKQFRFEIAEPNVMSDIAISSGDKYLIANGSAGFDVYSSDGKRQRTVKVTTVPNGNVQTVSITTTKDDRILVGWRSKDEAGKSDEFFITIHGTTGSKIIPIRIRPIRIR